MILSGRGAFARNAENCFIFAETFREEIRLFQERRNPMRYPNVTPNLPSSPASFGGPHCQASAAAGSPTGIGRFCFQNPVLEALLGLGFGPRPAAEFGPRELEPLITIAIPAYDRPELLAETLASIAAQTADVGLEVIVCDDGLMPETRAVVERHRGHGFRYLANPKRLGPVENWNQCLRIAAGEWVMVLHEDDTLYPWYLDSVLPRLGTGAVAVCTRTTNGCTPPVLRRPRITGAAMDYVPQYFLKSSMSPFPGVLVRRDVAMRLGGFDARWGPIADYEFWYRLSRVGRIEVVGVVGAFYRVAHGQWTERIWRRMLRLTHLLRLQIAREQFPKRPRLGRWAARFFTFRNARWYSKRFGPGTAILRRCIGMGAMPFARLPSGWVWQALKFASLANQRHFDALTDEGRTPQIQQDRRGPHRLAEEDSLRGSARHAQTALARPGRIDRQLEGEAWNRDPDGRAGDSRQVA
jgi:glycosyltransferase involved in cell wall biosynthesis